MKPSVILGVVVIATIGACTQRETLSSDLERMHDTGPLAGVSAAPTAAPSAEVEVAGDDDVLAVLSAASRARSTEADLAGARGHDIALKQLAVTLSQHGLDAANRLEELARKQGKATLDGPTVRDISRRSERSVELLRTETGDVFDVDFMETEAEGLQRMLMTLDEQLVLVSVNEPEETGALTDVRATIARDLSEVRALRKKLGEP
ncbi:MAG TPA: DUF4142 domain-containing protein [Byssovorax sp.]|jgi:hypothetical protein